LLPIVLQTNLRAVRDRAAEALVMGRFTEIARLLTGDPAAQAEDGIQWLRELCEALSIPALRTYGVREADFPEIIAAAEKSSSMKGNPIKLTDRECIKIMEAAL
jgi:alcohol dehydrogenase class IV